MTHTSAEISLDGIYMQLRELNNNIITLINILNGAIPTDDGNNEDEVE
jgi:hypothetical protein